MYSTMHAHMNNFRRGKWKKGYEETAPPSAALFMNGQYRAAASKTIVAAPKVHLSNTN